jgi:hypothetical protein
VVFAVAGLVVLLGLADQLGVRRLSGADFPTGDPLGRDEQRVVEKLAAPEWGGRKPGTPGNAEAARWLAHELEAAGAAALPSLGDRLAPLTDAAGRPRTDLGHNVIAWLPPTAPPTGAAPAAIVLGAHFDHVGPTAEGTLLGADDNASGVAVVLGAIPSIAARQERRRPVIVVLFDTEELPYFGTPLQGSRALMRAPPPEVGARPALAIVLDLIGGVLWRHTAESIFACGAEKTRGLSAVVDDTREEGLDVRRLGIHMVENIPGHSPSPFSDYDVFRAQRVPFLFLSSGRTPRYHKATDLPPTLHYDRMARTSRWIARLVAALDTAELGPYDPGGEDYPTDLRQARWFLDAAARPWTAVPGTGPVTLARLVGDRSRLAGMTETGHVFTPDDVLALERASFRVQCLVYAYPVCFTL